MYDVDKLERSDAETTRSSLLRMLEHDLTELESRLGSPRTRKSTGCGCFDIIVITLVRPRKRRLSLRLFPATSLLVVR